MVTKFKESLLELIDSKHINSSTNTAPSILLAVSGGIDSMCMAHLFSRVFYSNYAIATVNFSLRGEESDGDENLVHEWADSNGIKCYSTTFDTIKYASDKGISTQMAARDLRYNWFETLVKEHSFEYLAIAHNLNDSVETFFINTLRGTGIQGLTGIRKKNGYIIRPLLGLTRSEIVDFVKQENIPFREDSTNAQSHYSRNRLRNLVFPEFEMINQSFLRTVERDMANVEAAVDVLQDLLIEKKNDFFDIVSSKISIEKLLKENRPDFWLYEILRDYGFNPDQIAQINESLKGQSGKEFHSESHLLIKDRDSLLLYSKGGSNAGNSSVNALNVSTNELLEVSSTLLPEKLDEIDIPLLTPGERTRLEFLNNSIELTLYPKPKGFSYKKKQATNTALMGDLFSSTYVELVETRVSMPEPVLYLDADLLQFPIKLRSWKDGDKFMPLGMQGFKKLSDFMIDLKIDKIAKTQVPILLSGDDIATIIGYRIDERYKVTASSKNILEIAFV